MGTTIEILRAAVETARIEADRAEAHRVETSKLPVNREHRLARVQAGSAADRARTVHCDALRALRAVEPV